MVKWYHHGLQNRCSRFESQQACKRVKKLSQIFFYVKYLWYISSENEQEFFDMLVKIVLWCNGSTSGFGPENRGSNPCGTTIDLLAQLVEQYTFNVWVLGSSPRGITNKCLYRIAAIAADCKSAPIRVRRFESFCRHKRQVVKLLGYEIKKGFVIHVPNQKPRKTRNLPFIWICSSVGRAED